jgi:hypothetical protein
MYGYEVLSVWTLTTDTNGYFLLCDSILNRNLYWLVCTRSLVLCIGFCRLLFVLFFLFLLVIVLSVLRVTDSDYTFGIFKLLVRFRYVLVFHFQVSCQE